MKDLNNCLCVDKPCAEVCDANETLNAMYEQAQPACECKLKADADLCDEAWAGKYTEQADGTACPTKDDGEGDGDGDEEGDGEEDNATYLLSSALVVAATLLI